MVLIVNFLDFNLRSAIVLQQSHHGFCAFFFCLYFEVSELRQLSNKRKTLPYISQVLWGRKGVPFPFLLVFIAFYRSIYWFYTKLRAADPS